VLAFLFEIAPFLKRQGLGRLVYLDQEMAPGQFTYKVKINLDEYVLLAEEERGAVIPWVAVPARAFALVNRLLARSGSRERIYTTQGSIAQSSLAIFLTDELYELISASGLLSEEEKLLTIEELLRLI
jgi:hypothetical protein